MHMLDVIAARRDGKAHSNDELAFLANGAADGSIPDYQLSAWLMAAYLNPLDREQTAGLTQAMADSGDRVDLTGLPRPWVDKHSTGGVGDKTTLVLLPLLASCRITMAKMSGRGLGITGGTVDKLEAVPGFRLDLTPEELKAQATRIGVAISGQTPRLAPADKTLYGLRDVTGTIASIPLIVSSVLCKKIAGGAEIIVLDVKCGGGAFMADLPRARQLAQELCAVGKLCGLNVWVSITDMSQPLGVAVGNALEVREAIDVLRGGGPPRFRELCLRLAQETLEACELPTGRALEVLDSGAALKRADEWFRAQGCPYAIDEVCDHLAAAPVVKPVMGTVAGWVNRVDARIVGEVVVELGGGRREQDDVVNPAVGVECLVHVGRHLEGGETLFRIHAASQDAAERAASRLVSAVSVVEEKVEPTPLILEQMRS